MTTRLPDPPKRFEYLTWSPRGYPIPSTTGRDERDANFAALSERRKLALVAFDWCAVCGMPFNNETRRIPGPERTTAQPSTMSTSEMPVHELCLLYAVLVCPFLLGPNARLHDQGRVGQVRDTSTSYGYRHTATASVERSPFQRDTRILEVELVEPVGTWSWGHGREVAERYVEALAQEQPIVLRAGEEQLIRLFNSFGDAGDTVAGAAVMAGAAFLVGIRQMQGARRITDDTYSTMAAHFLTIEEVDWTSKDPATAAVTAYLRDAAPLPRVLAHWREGGRQRIVRRQPREKLPGRNAPCSCGSGRKYKHCHGAPAR